MSLTPAQVDKVDEARRHVADALTILAELEDELGSTLWLNPDAAWADKDTYNRVNHAYESTRTTRRAIRDI